MQTPSIPNDTLKLEYVDNRMSIKDLSKKYDVPPHSIRRRLRVLNIPQRYVSRPIEIDRETLFDCYITKDMTVPQIARHYKISTGGVNNKLHEFRIPIKSQIIDLTGQIFGKLTVLRQDKSTNKVTSARWICRCSCGKEGSFYSSTLRKGHSSSCGCGWRTKFEEISGEYLSRVERNARIRNLVFSVSPQELWDKFVAQGKRCALSGAVITFSPNPKTHSQTASLDRIDSKKDYTKDNIQWVHKTVNRLKMAFPESEFLEWVGKISNHQKKLKTP